MQQLTPSILVSGIEADVPPRIESPTSAPEIDAVEFPEVAWDRLQPTGWYWKLRPILERFAAAVLLVLTSPLILFGAILIKLGSRGPVFYTQTRLGWRGRPFTIVKLRTMIVDAEASSGAVWASTGDPRITRVGEFLRKTHLDELPQLVNVVLGQMSLVGPRPERPEIVATLRRRVERYTDRLAVPAGITGLAQVQLPPDVDLEGVKKKLVCDRYYIQHFGAWLDFRILVCTGLLMLGVPLRWSRRWLAIPEPLRSSAS
jgi:lipopolysaccharide/colanic/teichoic acid biosynthesis glycosyltransferase